MRGSSIACPRIVGEEVSEERVRGAAIGRVRRGGEPHPRAEVDPAVVFRQALKRLPSNRAGRSPYGRRDDARKSTAEPRPASIACSSSRCPIATLAAASCGSARRSRTFSPRIPIPPALKHLLSEALVLTALMGALAQGRWQPADVAGAGGRRRSSACWCATIAAGSCAAMRSTTRSASPSLGANPSLSELFGGGYLAITFDLAATGQRYQGSRAARRRFAFARSVERYFAQSEQVPTLIRTGVRGGTAGSSPAACWSSTWPRARKAASGSMRAWIIRNGNMSRRSRAA